MIRQMREQDIAVCAEILCGVYNNELWQCRWSKERAIAYLTDLYHMPKFVGFVTEERNALVGGIFAREKVWWNNSEVYVEELFIRPEHQGKGCGKGLLRQVEAYVQEKGLAGITLSTNRYAPAARFYRGNGFSDCEHVLFMSKEMD